MEGGKTRWYAGRSPMTRERFAKRVIYDMLPIDGSEIQWSELEKRSEEVGISKSTLSKHLKKAQRLDLIKRRVDENSYPPKVYYKIHHKSPLSGFLLKRFEEEVDALKGRRPRKFQLNEEPLFAKDPTVYLHLFKSWILHFSFMVLQVLSDIYCSRLSQDEKEMNVEEEVDLIIRPWVYKLLNAFEAIEGVHDVVENYLMPELITKINEEHERFKEALMKNQEFSST